MPTPVDLDATPSTASHLADAHFDAFTPDVRDEDDGVFAEITERRAQLENADILRGARAL
jgi:hypothetical protein